MNLRSVKAMWKGVRRLAADERGAEGLEKLLIVGAVIIPLLGILIWFKDELSNWLGGQWEAVESDPNATYDSDTGPS